MSGRDRGRENPKWTLCCTQSQMQAGLSLMTQRSPKIRVGQLPNPTTQAPPHAGIVSKTIISGCPPRILSELVWKKVCQFKLGKICVNLTMYKNYHVSLLCGSLSITLGAIKNSTASQLCELSGALITFKVKAKPFQMNDPGWASERLFQFH